MRITELAERTGVTVRNIRFYHQLGVLARPTMRGRVGWYGPQHVERLAAVRRLQARGYSLAAIADMIDSQVPAILFDTPQAGTDDAARDRPQPVGGDDLRRVTRGQLEELVPQLREQPSLLADMEALGLLVPVDESTYDVPQPPLLRAGIALVTRGVPVPTTLDELRVLREELRAIANRFADILERDLLPAYTAGGRPIDEATHDLLDEVLPAVLVATGTILSDALYRAALSRLVSATQD